MTLCFARRTLTTVFLSCTALTAMPFAACGDDDDETSDGTGDDTSGDTGSTVGTDDDDDASGDDDDVTGDDDDTTGNDDDDDVTGDDDDTTGEPWPAEDETTPRRGCDPLVNAVCMLPFPSNHFLRRDDATPTGYRVWIDPEIAPKNKDGSSMLGDAEYERLDGFSPVPQLITYLPDLDTSALAGSETIERSLEDDAAVVLINADTGEREPYWVETDRQIESAPESDDSVKLTFIRAVRKVPPGSRFVVGIRNVRDTTGKAIEAEPLFAALRDGSPMPEMVGSDELERRRAWFESAVFPVLETAGVNRGELVQAWDFTVMSEATLTERLLRLVDDGLGRYAAYIEGLENPAPNEAAAEPPYVIDEVLNYTLEENPRIARRLVGRFKVPFYTELDEGAQSDKPGARLVLDEAGLPVFQNFGYAPFEMQIPRRGFEQDESDEPLRLLQYGHGLLQNAGQTRLPYHEGICETHGFVMYATDWSGMTTADLSHIASEVIGDLATFGTLPDRLQQSVLNHVILDKLVMGALSRDPNVQVPRGAGSAPVYDPSAVYYYGNSNGHILGEVFLSVTDDVERAVMGVGGTPYSLMLTRSVDFNAFLTLMKLQYPRVDDRHLAIELIQLLWNRSEPAGYVDHVIANPFEGRSSKKLLIHMAIEDSQVPNLSTHNIIRSHGMPQLKPANTTTFGIAQVDGPVSDAAYVDWDCKKVPNPVGNIAGQENEAHECVRQLAAAQQQISDFLQPGGVIANTCDGKCDPE